MYTPNPISRIDDGERARLGRRQPAPSPVDPATEQPLNRKPLGIGTVVGEAPTTAPGAGARPIPTRIPRTADTAAFTRIELVAIIAALALLATVTLPVLASSRGYADRVDCVNNLRQLGEAYHLWGNDHGDAMPIRTPFCEGGLWFYPTFCTDVPRPSWSIYINNAWFHYAWMSNEITTPRILACPADEQTKVARDFSGSLDGGFLNPGYRNQAVSYLIALDVFSGSTRSFIGADRNMFVNGYNVGCSSGVTTAAGINYHNSPNFFKWLTGLHNQSGNLLLYDGQVLQTTSLTLKRYADETLEQQGDNGVYHVLLPRL